MATGAAPTDELITMLDVTVTTIIRTDGSVTRCRSPLGRRVHAKRPPVVAGNGPRLVQEPGGVARSSRDDLANEREVPDDVLGGAMRARASDNRSGQTVTTRPYETWSDRCCGRMLKGGATRGLGWITGSSRPR
jgi:hypothetical protein